MFAVQCPKTVEFPAGRLHITIATDTENSNKLTTMENIRSAKATNLNYYCACKKLRILLQPNKLNELWDHECCDHGIMLLAGLLSSTTLQREFQYFMTSLNYLWVTDLIFEDDFLATEVINLFFFIKVLRIILNLCQF